MRGKLDAKKKDKMEYFFLIKWLEQLYRNNDLSQVRLILTSYWPNVRAAQGNIGLGRGSIKTTEGQYCPIIVEQSRFCVQIL